MVDIVGSFWKKNWLSGLWYQDQHWLSAKTSIFGLKSRTRARYYRRVCDTLAWVAVCILLSRCVLILEYRYWKLWEEDDEEYYWKNLSEEEKRTAAIKKTFFRLSQRI